LSFEQQTVRHKLDKIYEQLAKPGKPYCVYNNKHYQGEIILEEYRVDRIFQHKISGFYALGLISVSGENPSILVIRGFGNWGRLEEFPTEFLPYKDIPDVVLTKSDEQFQAAKRIGVIEWLQDKAIREMKPDVVGQSLGGKIGQQLTVEVPDYIHSLVTFNSIGISAKEYDKYQGNVKIFHYVNPDDLVPYVLGERFLPGTIFQVRNPTIKAYDLLGQHNKLVLDNPITLIEEIDIEAFYGVRELYKSVKNYGGTIKKKVESLRQIAKQEIIEYGIKLNDYEPEIWQKFENSRQAVQLGFIQIQEAIRKQLIEDTDRRRSAKLLQQQINSSIQLIQKEVENLSNLVQQEVKLKLSGKIFNGFSPGLQQELKDSIRTIHQKLDNFLQLETQVKVEETLIEGDVNGARP
jgi:hypothetical protein